MISQNFQETPLLEWRKFEDANFSLTVLTNNKTGEILFDAKEVCSYLEIKNVSQAMGRLDDDEKLFITNDLQKGICSSDTPIGGLQNKWFVTEPGFYGLALGSRKGKPLKRHVTHNILPEIRKTGSYSVVKEDLIRKEIMTRYILPEVGEYKSIFPDTFYEALYRLTGLQKKKNKKTHPRCFAIYTRIFVYDVMPPGIIEELDRLNPVQEKEKGIAFRKHKHHQFLTDNFGREHLKNHFIKLLTLMNASLTMKEFQQMFARAFPNSRYTKYLESGDLEIELKGLEQLTFQFFI